MKRRCCFVDKPLGVHVSFLYQLKLVGPRMIGAYLAHETSKAADDRSEVPLDSVDRLRAGGLSDAKRSKVRPDTERFASLDVEERGDVLIARVCGIDRRIQVRMENSYVAQKL